MTTVPSRLQDGTTGRTLASLEKGGFKSADVHLFIDGEYDPVNVATLWNSTTVRAMPLRVYGNFHLGLTELFIRNPHADYYAMFQDDFVTYRNLRQYLEACKYPGKGYLNLYTFQQNEKPEQGWYESNQLGKGAVALVFNNDAVVTLLNSPHWINRPATKPNNPARVWKFIDGGIVESFRKAGQKEYVHNPSLIQHTGDKSTLGNARHAKARTFKGEGFDAMELLR